MRIIYFLLIVSLFYLASAKYLPDKSSSSTLIRKQRSVSDESNVSTESNESNSDDLNNSDTVDSVERKIIEQQQKQQEKRVKEELKRVEKERRRREKIEQEERKLQEKLIEQERKQKEELEKEERKLQEKLEKAERKLQEEERRRQERIIKEERKRQEKQSKRLEEIKIKTLEDTKPLIDNSSESAEEIDSMDLDDIWKNYIYSIYALSANSNELEKKAAVNRYLGEELGLDANSTKSEYRQAVLQTIQSRLLNDSVAQSSFLSHLRNHDSAVNIQELSTDLENKIVELDNATAQLQNVSLPWVIEAQKSIAQTKTIIQSLVEVLSHALSSWITGGQVASSEASATNANSTIVSVSGADLSNTGGVVSDSNVGSVSTNDVPVVNAQGTVPGSLTHGSEGSSANGIVPVEANVAVISGADNSPAETVSSDIGSSSPMVTPLTGTETAATGGGSDNDVTITSSNVTASASTGAVDSTVAEISETGLHSTVPNTITLVSYVTDASSTGGQVSGSLSTGSSTDPTPVIAEVTLSVPSNSTFSNVNSSGTDSSNAILVDTVDPVVSGSTYTETSASNIAPSNTASLDVGASSTYQSPISTGVDATGLASSDTALAMAGISEASSSVASANDISGLVSPLPDAAPVDITATGVSESTDASASPKIFSSSSTAATTDSSTFELVLSESSVSADILSNVVTANISTSTSEVTSISPLNIVASVESPTDAASVGTEVLLPVTVHVVADEAASSLAVSNSVSSLPGPSETNVSVTVPSDDFPVITNASVAALPDIPTSTGSESANPSGATASDVSTTEGTIILSDSVSVASEIAAIDINTTATTSFDVSAVVVVTSDTVSADHVEVSTDAIVSVNESIDSVAVNTELPVDASMPVDVVVSEPVAAPTKTDITTTSATITAPSVTSVSLAVSDALLVEYGTTLAASSAPVIFPSEVATSVVVSTDVASTEPTVPVNTPNDAVSADITTTIPEAAVAVIAPAKAEDATEVTVAAEFDAIHISDTSNIYSANNIPSDASNSVATTPTNVNAAKASAAVPVINAPHGSNSTSTAFRVSNIDFSIDTVPVTDSVLNVDSGNAVSTDAVYTNNIATTIAPPDAQEHTNNPAESSLLIGAEITPPFESGASLKEVTTQ